MSANLKQYIGDSVYADFDGYHVVLTTENGLSGDPSNRIYLAPPEMDALIKYFQWLEHHPRVEKGVT
jgi:hypothetical protein